MAAVILADPQDDLRRVALGRGERSHREPEPRQVVGQGDRRHLEVGAGGADDLDLDRTPGRAADDRVMGRRARRGPRLGPSRVDPRRPRPRVGRRRFRVDPGRRQRGGPAPIQVGERRSRRRLQAADAAAVRADQRRGTVRAESVDAPAEEEVRAAPVAVAPEEVGGVIILDDQAVSLGPRQEGADAVVEVRPREPVEVLDQVGESPRRASPLPRAAGRPSRAREGLAAETSRRGCIRGR